MCLTFKEVEVRMQELIDSLERCVRQSTFVSDRMGKIGWNDYRHLFRTKRWDDSTWMLWGASRLEIKDVHVAELVARLEPVLAEFVHTGTGRIGNGLFLLLGGLGTWAHPTVTEGDDEASRVPGKPTRTHATRSDPGEVAASTPRPLRRGEMTFRPTHDVGPRTQCISGLNHAAYGLPVNASRPGSPQAHASLGSGWRPTLAGWDWIPTGFRTRFRRSHHGILSPLTGLSRHTRCCTNRHGPARCPPTGSSRADAI